MSKKKSTIKTALGIGGAVAAISAGAIYLGRKIFCRKHDEETEETEDNEVEEETEDTEEESEEEE